MAPSIARSDFSASNRGVPANTLITVRWCGMVTYKPIETIQIGDEVLTHTGHWRKVVLVHNSIAATIILRDVDGHRLELTPDHKLWCSPSAAPNSGRWKPAAAFDLDRDHWSRVTAEGPNTTVDPERGFRVADLSWRFVSDQHPDRQAVTVYNIDVSEDHSYVAEGVLVKS